MVNPTAPKLSTQNLSLVYVVMLILKIQMITDLDWSGSQHINIKIWIEPGSSGMGGGRTVTLIITSKYYLVFQSEYVVFDLFLRAPFY